MRKSGNLRKATAERAAPSMRLDRIDSPIARFVNFCWFFFKLGVTLLLVAVVTIGVYLFTRANEEIRYFVEQTLSERMPHLNISVGGARLVEGRGIAIYDMTISETSDTQLQNNLVVVDEIMLVCDVELSQLFNGAPQVDRVIVKHPQLFVTKQHDSRWNLESFLPLPKPCENRPPIVIQDAQVSFSDQQKQDLSPLVLRDVNFTLSGAQQCPSKDVLKLAGTLSGPNLQRANLQATVNLAKNSLHLAGDFRDLQLDADLISWAYAYAGTLVGPTVVRGSVDGEFDAQIDLQGKQPPQVQARCQVSEGRLEDPRLPRPVTELTATIICEQDKLKLEELHGACGSATLAVSLERNGWNPNAPIALAARVESLPLDKKLYSALPQLLRTEWDKYLPTGIVDAELKATFDGRRWLPHATLSGRDLAFEADKFRYRTSDGSGTLTYRPPSHSEPAILDIDLVATGGGRPLKIVGQVFSPAPLARGWVEVSGQNVKIEKRMIAALPEKTRDVIESLHPEGTMNVHWRMERQVAGIPSFRKSLRLELIDARVNYDKFPYPLSGINGFVLAENDDWTFRDLVSSGNRNVQCNGTLTPTSNGKELRLNFVASQIPMDRDLKHAVPQSVAEAWERLRPRGQIDLTADLYHLTGYTKPALRVVVKPRPEIASIEPTFFPYLMEKLEGTITYQEGQVDLSHLRAQHGRTRIRTNGNGFFGEDGSWNMQLEGLSADRLSVEKRDLIGALPHSLQKLIEQMKPTGRFGLENSVLRFSQAGGPATQLESSWDVHLDCHQTDLQVGIDLKNIYGKVRLMGACKGTKCYSSGELEIDTATFEGVQFTDVRGPFWGDERSFRLGKWAATQQGQTARRLSATVYGGDVRADAWVTFNGLPQYRADAQLASADLSRLTKERFQTTTDFKGKVAANITVWGRGRQLENMEAQGDVQITDAEIYELPLLVRLLKVLRTSAPDTTAFNQSDIKFRIQGRHIYLDQLDFLGDAVSLFGKGYTNFDHQLNLAFYGIVGRNEIRLPLVKNFVNQLGQSTLQMYVDGTLSDPQIHTQAFPMVNQLIEQIQSDLEATGGGTNPREAKRGYLVAPPGSTNR